MLESIYHLKPALQGASVEDKARGSQELAQSRVDKPELTPAAKAVQDPGPFRRAQRSVSELQLNLIRTGSKVYGIRDTERSMADYKPDALWWRAEGQSGSQPQLPWGWALGTRFAQLTLVS